MFSSRALLHQNLQRVRSCRGQAISILIVILTVFVIAPLSLFTIEVVRYSLAKQQLKACVDSCALAAAATTACGNSTDPLVTQENAIATAIDMCKRNSLLGQSLINATQSPSLGMNPAPDQTLLYFEFLDPVNRQPVALGSTRAKVIQVTASYGLTPWFGTFLGFSGVYPVVESANGGLPMLDIILCFDISSSMDDFTPVSIVNRYKNGNYNGYRTISQGNLYNAFHCTGPTGTALNATFPQNLDANDGSYSFSSSARGTNNGAAAISSVSSQYTDVVVNIDGTSNFTNGALVTSGGTTYVFPPSNVGCLVEAARGNLESVTVANNAKVPYASWGVVPKSGYYNAYVQAAFGCRRPVCDAIDAAKEFFTIMNNDCDVHFGLVTFGNDVGNSVTSQCASDIGYSSIGNVTDNPAAYKSNAFPKDPLAPRPPNSEIDLDPNLGPDFSNFDQVSSAVEPLIAYGGTNISGALDCALDQLRSSSQGGRGLARKGATKAIVLFTDGLPTRSSFGGDPSMDARAQARLANQYGIPVYCIGLCMVPSLQSTQTEILNDEDSNHYNGGIAGISGNGAQFFQATELSQLNLVFEYVARSLVQLVR
ncbi:MAG: VWA domain-containing protein [Candidatus Melainabacteria bacterium]|nr:VWA domain-containing protein [Candidatus Melainabacteria bacterium]